MTRRALAVLVAVLGAAVGATTLTILPAAAADPLRVLIVGDSVTHGSAGDWTWRYRLWQEFQRQGIAVDFVGPRDDLFDNVAGEAGSQDYLDPAFDRDHASGWGAAFGWEEHRIDDLVREYEPDVALVMLGLNNLTWLGQTPEQVRDQVAWFVDAARSVDPDLELVLGKVPQTSARATVATFNALVDAYSSQTPGTATADSEVDFITGVDTWDPAHASATGEVKIAAAMTDALAELGHMSRTPWPLAAVVNGPRVRPAVWGALNDGLANLTWSLPPGATSAWVWQRVDGGPWERIPQEQRSGSLAVPVGPDQRVDFWVQPVKGWHAAAVDAFSEVVSVDTTPPPPPLPPLPPPLPPVVAPDAPVAEVEEVAAPVVEPPASGAPRAVKVRKVGRRLVVTWRAGQAASRYKVLVRVAGKWRTRSTTSALRWRSKAMRPGRYSVKVQSYGGAQAGKVSPARSVRL